MSYRAEKLMEFEIRLREAKSLSIHERKMVKDVAMKIPWTIGSELIAEDVKGDVEGICFYNFDPTLENTKMFREGAILLIKEPNLRLTNISCERFIRVDSPSDVIFINFWDKAFLERVNALRWHKPEELTFEQLKKNGNDQFNQNQYDNALHYYDRALATAQLEEQTKIIHLNRAAALLSLERFHEAEEAATKALDVNLKALYRLGKAAYGMRNWEKAVEMFEALMAESKKLGDENAAQNAAIELEKAKERLAESTTGKYDQWKLFGFNKQNGLKGKQEKFYDMADYIGPVKIAKIPGKGMGLVITENVEKGQLLLVSKAFVMIYKESAIFDAEQELPKLTIQCLLESVQKLHKNPQSAKDLYALYAGPGVDREKKKIPAEVIDAERIEMIINQNAFATQDNLIEHGMLYEIPGTAEGDKRLMMGGFYQPCSGYGLWLLPSFINHACFYNSMRYTCGDMMFIYSLCDLKCGDEITINYVDPFQSLSERENEFRHQWKFKCDCKLCKLERADPNGKKRNILLDQIQHQFGEIPSLIRAGRSQEALALTQLHVRQLRDTYSGREDQLLRFQLLPAILRQAFVLEHVGKFTEAAKLFREILDQICPQIANLRYQYLPVIHYHLAKIYAFNQELGGLEAAKRVADEAFELFSVKTGVKERKLFAKMFSLSYSILAACNFNSTQ